MALDNYYISGPHMFFEKQWVVCRKNVVGAHSTAPGIDMMPVGEIFQIDHIATDRAAYFYTMKNGGRDHNFITFSDLMPWCPNPGDECVVQKVLEYTDYGDGPSYSPRRSPHGCASLCEGEIVRALQRTKDLMIMYRGNMFGVSSNGVHYKEFDGSQDRWLWLYQLAPLGKLSFGKKSCSCEVVTLMRSGCTCGAIKKYQDTFGA